MILLKKTLTNYRYYYKIHILEKLFQIAPESIYLVCQYFLKDDLEYNR